MTPKPRRTFAVKRVLGIFWRHAMRYPVAVSLGTLFTILAITCDVFIPLYYKKILDEASAAAVPTHAVGNALIAILLIAIGTILLRQIARRTGSFANTYFQPKIMRDLSRSAFSYLQGHSYQFFSDNFTGALVRKVTRLSKSFEDVADRLTFDLIPLVVILIGITTVLFMRDILLGSIYLAWVLLFMLAQIGVAQWKIRYNLKVSETDSEATGMLSDSIANNVTVKLFAGETHERSLFAEVSEKLARRRFKSWSVDEIVAAVQATLMVVIELALMVVAIKLWEQGILAVGDFALIQAYIIASIDRLWTFGGSIKTLYEAFADATEVAEIMHAPHEIQDRPDAKPLSVTDGAIAFRDVRFSFIADRTVLDAFDLSIAGHEKVALVGPSGAGKTTITKLVVRFHDIDGGEITIDGQDIAGVTQESLRRAIAFVPQEPTLFHRTLMENIRYGRLDATDEEVIEAAKQANAYEFIMRSPEGFSTYVGERGIKLSGGERQRVAVARAILKDAPILILDEATSSLDSESEALIQDALTRLMEGKTVIAIAHRLSTVMKMDRIIVIEDGKVVMSGTHHELVSHEGGLYQKLWEIQAGGFLADDTEV